MTDQATHAAIAALLGELTGVAPTQTPLSAVFVGRDRVLKLRKPVRLAFVDQSSCTQRERFARREMALNAPHAPGLYRGIHAVVRRPGGALALVADTALAHQGLTDQISADHVLDWVVETATVPADDFLGPITERGDLDAALQDAVADAIANYHLALPPVERDRSTGLQAIAAGNARSAKDAGLDGLEIDAWHTEVTSALEARMGQLQARTRGGFVRRAHGDLHLGNICLWQGRPVLFDALEFDEDLATIDLGYDLAFLLMDIARRLAGPAGRRAANRVLNRYVARTGDAGVVGALPPFISMRAMIRAHVEQASGHQAAARDYLAMSRSALRPRPPILVALGGFPGSGKSTYARLIAPDLGPAPGALILRSDEIRKRLHGRAPEERLPKGAYGNAESRRVFEILIAQAREGVAQGHAVIADATFLAAADQAAIRDAAGGRPFHGIWLDAPLATLRARVEARHGDASDATVAILARMARSHPGGAPAGWIGIDTTDQAAALGRIDIALNQRHAAC